ncbi:uncharacterized protein TNCV_1984201 [Trichonephila clavipes]|nr:uncharacterized protein TNCV_1984201 [Trichonephila clavipes]
MPSIGGYPPYGLASILTGLESNRACVGYAWPANCSPSTPPTCLPELRRALLDEWCNIPQDQIDNLILSMPRRCKNKRPNTRAGGVAIYQNSSDAVNRITPSMECSVSQSDIYGTIQSSVGDLCLAEWE